MAQNKFDIYVYAHWKEIAREIGISRAEQELMGSAFMNGIDLS